MVGNGDGMLRAALETEFLSAVTNLIGIVNLSSCAFLPPEIYRMLAPGHFVLPNIIIFSILQYVKVFLCDEDFQYVGCGLGRQAFLQPLVCGSVCVGCKWA